jgi:PASTA domain
MSSPAPRPHEEPPDEQYGWPQPRELRQPRPLRRAVPQPSARPRRRSWLGRVWLVLALLGVVLAIVAGVWYSRIAGGPPSRLSVPTVVGLKESVAIRKLTTLGLSVRSVEMPANSKEGLVFRQRPAAGSTLPRGTTVTIDVASGK